MYALGVLVKLGLLTRAFGVLLWVLRFLFELGRAAGNFRMSRRISRWLQDILDSLLSYFPLLFVLFIADFDLGVDVQSE